QRSVVLAVRARGRERHRLGARRERDDGRDQPAVDDLVRRAVEAGVAEARIARVDLTGEAVARATVTDAALARRTRPILRIPVGGNEAADRDAVHLDRPHLERDGPREAARVRRYRAGDRTGDLADHAELESPGFDGSGRSGVGRTRSRSAA